MRDIFKSHYKNFSKFTIVGVVNTVIDFTVFWILHEFFVLDFIIAHIAAFFIALGNSFIFNALWTFSNLKTEQVVRQVLSFIAVGLMGLLLSTLTLYALHMVMPVYVAKIGAVFVSLFWNYIGSHCFVFKT